MSCVWWKQLLVYYKNNTMGWVRWG